MGDSGEWVGGVGERDQSFYEISVEEAFQFKVHRLLG